jgi:cell shape-determining protein MreC
MAELEQENQRLRERLAKAETIIDVQKKVSSLLGITLSQPPTDVGD